jgi:hypothetical protein
MSMFPISIEGAIDIWADSADAALNRLNDAIVAKGAIFIERRPDELAFTGRVYFPVSISWKPNPLLMFDRCVISAQHEKIQYKCSTRFVLVVVTAMTMLVWFAMLTASVHSIPLPILLIFPPFMWLFVFGFNYLRSRNRLQQFLEDVVWGPETSTR